MEFRRRLRRGGGAGSDREPRSVVKPTRLPLGFNTHLMSRPIRRDLRCGQPNHVKRFENGEGRRSLAAIVGRLHLDSAHAAAWSRRP